MKKILFSSVIFLVFMLLFFSIALVVAVYKPHVYEGLVNKWVYTKTGYQYATKDISVQMRPLNISIQGLELKNSEWASNPLLLEIKQLEVKVDTESFLKNNFPFWNATITGANIYFIENKKGKVNWLPEKITEQPNHKDDKKTDFKNILSFSELNLLESNFFYKKADETEKIHLANLNISKSENSSINLNGSGEYQQQSVDIQGSIAIQGKQTEQLFSFDLLANGLGIQLESKGTVDPNNFNHADIFLQANASDLSQLENFLQTTFPTLTPVKVSLDLLSSDSKYQISHAKIRLGENYLHGDISYDQDKSFVRAYLQSEKIDLTPFMAASENQAEAGSSDKENDIIKNDIEAKIDWSWLQRFDADLEFRIDEILTNEHQLQDLYAKINVAGDVINIESLQSKYAFHHDDEPNNLFVTDLLKIEGTIQPIMDITQAEDIKLALNISDPGANLNIQGVANLNGVDGNQINLDLEAKSLPILSDIMQFDFAPILPITAKLDIKTEKDALLIEQFQTMFNDSDLSGNINADWSTEVLKLNAQIDSKWLEITPFLPNDESQNEEDNENKDKLFSDEAIDWSWLSGNDINLALATDALIVDKSNFKNFKTKLALSEDALLIEPLQASFANGSINSVIELKKTDQSSDLNLQLDAINISLAEMGATSETVLEGGTTDIVLNLSGEGESLHQIMSSLNGEMVAEVQKGTIKNDAFEIIGTDVVLELFTMLNPFIREDETTELECAAVKFLAKDGVLTSKNQLAIETSKMKIVGGGIIDLSSEELEIGFSPTAKKGFGVNMGSLVKFVRLGGTLRKPQPEADPVGMLKSGAAIGAAMSTGGLSLLVEGLLKRAANSDSACNQALKENLSPAEHEAESLVE